MKLLLRRNIENVGKIGEIGRLDLDSPHDQLTLRAAIAIDALGS